MHDLHAADQILKQVLKYGQKNNLKKITKIKLELGVIAEHSEVLSSANLKFNLNLLSEKTIAHNAKIEIKKIKGNNFQLQEIQGVK